MKKEILNRLVSTFIFLILISAIHWQLQINLIFLGLGIVLGSFLLDLDQILYCYLQAPHEFTPQRVKRFFSQKQFQEGLILLAQTQEERPRTVFHSALFQLILLGVSFFVLSSSASLLGKGLVLGLLLHSLTDQAEGLIKRGEIVNWFWQFRAAPSKEFQKLYFTGFTLVFLVFSFFFV